MLRRPMRFSIIGLLSLITLLNSCSRVVTPPEPQPILFGAYTRGDINLDLSAIQDLEQDLNHTLDIVQWFTNFDHPWEADAVKQAALFGRIPMITWQPTGHSLDSILSGVDDNYLREWARGAKTYGKSIYIRLMPEMNGDWVTWSGDPEKYIATWRYIINKFRQEGATNVKWIWAPNCMDGPRDDPAYFMERYYPGQAYVDVIGLSGFNWGNVEKIHIWRTYEDIFLSAYERLNKIADHRFWVVETASAEDSKDSQRKADWIKSMFTSTVFPKVEAIIWFNEDKEHDWRVQSSAPSLQAFREILDSTNEGRELLATSYLQ
jgi:Glycosyl hydrolase family 26